VEKIIKKRAEKRGKEEKEEKRGERGERKEKRTRECNYIHRDYDQAADDT